MHTQWRKKSEKQQWVTSKTQTIAQERCNYYTFAVSGQVLSTVVLLSSLVHSMSHLDLGSSSTLEILHCLVMELLAVQLLHHRTPALVSLHCLLWDFERWGNHAAPESNTRQFRVFLRKSDLASFLAACEAFPLFPWRWCWHRTFTVESFKAASTKPWTTFHILAAW